MADVENLAHLFVLTDIGSAFTSPLLFFPCDAVLSWCHGLFFHISNL